jgi:hypothetical protein
MSSNPPSKHSYWLETAVHSALGPPPQLRPKSRLCSVLQTLGISKKPTSVALTVFSGVSNTRVIISGLDWAGKTTLLRNQISLDSTRTGKDIETCAPFIGMLIKTLSCYRYWRGCLELLSSARVRCVRESRRGYLGRGCW